MVLKCHITKYMQYACQMDPGICMALTPAREFFSHTIPMQSFLFLPVGPNTDRPSLGSLPGARELALPFQSILISPSVS